MFWPNFLLLLLSLFLLLLLDVVVSWLLLFLVVVVPGCSWLLPVGACWCLLVACWCLLVPVGACCLCVVGVFKIFGPLPRTSLRWTTLPLDRPKFRFFFSLPQEISFFLLSLEVFSLNFGGVFEDRAAQMCTFGLSGCRVKPRRPHQFQYIYHVGCGFNLLSIINS